MSKRRNPPETPEPSKLRRPLADAEAMLDKQIARGEAIAAGLRRGELPPEARQWDDENAAILERLFTGPESTEYKNSIVVVSIDYGDDD